MDNVMFTDATLFSTVHPDMEKRTSVSSILMSAVIAVLGIGAFVSSMRMDDATSTWSMVLMTGGTVLLLVALFRLFWKSKEWVYIPTGSVAKDGSCYFDICDLQALNNLLEQRTFDTGVDVKARSNGNARMDYMVSRDKKFAAVQLFRFVPYTYEAASSVFYLTGKDATSFVRCLETGNF